LIPRGGSIENMIVTNVIVVMADFCSSGLWGGIQGPMIEYETLNLPPDLVKKFEDWIEFYDTKCHTPRHYSFKPEMAEELNNQGRALAKKLKALFPNDHIYYRGEIEGDMLDHEEITGA